MIALSIWFGCCVIGISVDFAASKIVDALKELKGTQ